MASKIAGAVETMSLGRPVLPPEVTAFQEEAAFGSSGSQDRAGSGSKPIGTAGLPGFGCLDPDK